MSSVPATALDKEELRRTIAEVIDVEPAEVGDERRFVEDLGVDSLMALEVAVVLEKRYRVKLRQADLKHLLCLRMVFDLMRDKLGQGQP
ncbi:MAG TPA: acyl carrier protein [Micromonosporaceae bacterium]|nr:acyl carrier protein [Micromonosporaceae bacterium]